MLDKCTPGEWQLTDDGAKFIIVGPFVSFIHNHSTNEIENERMKKTPESIEQKTNAQLMAASKNMYIALKGMVKELEISGVFKCPIAPDCPNNTCHSCDFKKAYLECIKSIDKAERGL